MSITSLLSEKSSPFYVFAYFPTGIAISAILWNLFTGEHLLSLSPAGVTFIYLSGGFVAAVFASFELFERGFNKLTFHYYFKYKQKRTRYKSSYQQAVLSSLLNPARNKVVVLINLMFSMAILVILGSPLVLVLGSLLTQSIDSFWLGLLAPVGFFLCFYGIEISLFLRILDNSGFKAWIKDKSDLPRRSKKAMIKVDAVYAYRLAVSEGREEHAANILTKIALGLWDEVIDFSNFIRTQARGENKSTRHLLRKRIKRLKSGVALEALKTWFDIAGGYLQAWFEFLLEEQSTEYEEDRKNLIESSFVENGEVKLDSENVHGILSMLLETDYFFKEISHTSMHVRLGSLKEILERYRLGL